MIRIKNIVKNFVNGTVVTNVLKGINLEIPTGQFVAIIGPSGTGKSTLLYQMSLIDRPTSGDVFIDEQLVSNLNESEKTSFRLENFGFVFQDYALIPEFTALDNVILPNLMMGTDINVAKKMAKKVFESFSIAHLATHLPSQLSGGEQQRVSVSRAIAKKPKILFADEPTANLDSVASAQVMEILKKINKDGQTIIMVTHEEKYAHMADRLIQIKDGQVVKDTMLK
ncbi:MAG: ABC transporter ATP-binding protein [Elusimicrobiota bacterium]|nr:ABC transporter ATP-binding protein [Elusimicrobiota bacterium]